MSVPDSQLDPPDDVEVLDAFGEHELTACRCWECRAYWIDVRADERYDLQRGN